MALRKVSQNPRSNCHCIFSIIKIWENIENIKNNNIYINEILYYCYYSIINYNNLVS